MQQIIDASKYTEEIDETWDSLWMFTNNKFAAAGILGNLYCESGWKANNLQNSYAKKFGMSDAQYTKAVDDGSYKSFATDKAGYGLAQWTTKARKQNLYGLAKFLRSSVGDDVAQMNYLELELLNYSEVLKKLKVAMSVHEASNIILTQYEKPRNITESKKSTRAAYSMDVYLHYVGRSCDQKLDLSSLKDFRVLKRGCKGKDVGNLQTFLIKLGYKLPKYGADGSYGKETAMAVKAFQMNNDLYVDGIAGSVTRFIAGEQYAELFL